MYLKKCKSNKLKSLFCQCKYQMQIPVTCSPKAFSGFACRVGNFVLHLIRSNTQDQSGIDMQNELKSHRISLKRLISTMLIWYDIINDCVLQKSASHSLRKKGSSQSIVISYFWLLLIKVSIDVYKFFSLYHENSLQSYGNRYRAILCSGFKDPNI